MERYYDEQFSNQDFPFITDMYQMQPMHMNGMTYTPSGNCIPQETSIINPILARSYVAFEKLCNTYSPLEGLKRGTIFPELVRPYQKKEKDFEKMDSV